MKLRLEARVSSDLPDAVGRFLVGKFGATSVARDGNDWFVRAAGHRGLVPVVLRYGVCLAKQGNGQNVMGSVNQVRCPHARARGGADSSAL